MESVLNNPEPAVLDGSFHVGVDLGTSDIVVVVLDASYEPVAVFLEWAEVVRDGVVLDYWNATKIVSELIQAAELKLGIEIKTVVTSYPPGTDPRISENVIKAAGKQVAHIIDEPSSVAFLLDMSSGAVVDIGGGTTGIAIVENGNVVYTADEATGGRHVTLTIAGNRKMSFEEAEKLKLNGEVHRLTPIVEPVFQKMASIIQKHIQNRNIHELYLSGGTCCFPGLDTIFQEELSGRSIIKPYNPLFLTPLAIASYKKAHYG
jgi:ethanolamine utilization protein EutJ